MRIVKQPLPSSSTEVAIDVDSLKFFKSKVRVWEYAKISASDFQKLSFDDRSSIFKNYYLDMSTKCSMGAGKMFVFSFWSVSDLFVSR